jgi:hypothetical protein
MKSKPAKGSARTKRFDVGGTVGALAGLGTLAYLLSRKKKDAATGNEGSGESTAKPVIKSMMDTEDDAAKQRAMAASKGRPEMGDATNDDITTKKTTTPVVKKTTSRPTASTSTSKSAPAAKSFSAPADNATLKSKPYPAAVRSSDERPSKTSPMTVKQAMNKSADTSMPKGFNTKGTNKTVYGTDTTSVFQKKAAQERAEAEEKAKKKAKDEAQAKEFRERSLQPLKKGGNVKKYADGGMTSSKPEPKKAPMPAFAREAKENRERDQRVKKEQEAYDKGAPTRLKDQGSFKNGGMTASKRADGIAMRGKTRGKMY